MSKRSNKSLTLAQRVDVLERLGNEESQASIASAFGVNQSQISRIRKDKDKIIDDWQRNINPDRKRRRLGKCEDVEEALLRWFSGDRQELSHQLPVSSKMLMQKADQLADGLGVADFKATNGWLERWKKRNSIQFRKQQVEKQDAPDDFDAGNTADTPVRIEKMSGRYDVTFRHFH